jgi:hypothetical protein
VATLEARIKEVLDLVADDVMLREFCLPFYKSGVQATFVGTGQIPVLGSGIILGVRARLATAPTGATTFKVDVNKNGTTIFGTQTNRPTWVASANAATVGAHSVTTFADGDYFSVDVDAIGSSVAGSDLTLGLYLLRTGS